MPVTLLGAVWVHGWELGLAQLLLWHRLQGPGGLPGQELLLLSEPRELSQCLV